MTAYRQHMHGPAKHAGPGAQARFGLIASMDMVQMHTRFAEIRGLTTLSTPHSRPLEGGAAATMWAAPNYEVLLAGRIAYGLGIGFAMHAAPAYIAECVSGPASRHLQLHLCSCAAAQLPSGLERQRRRTTCCILTAMPAQHFTLPRTGAIQRAGAAHQPEGGAYLRRRALRLLHWLSVR